MRLLKDCAIAESPAVDVLLVEDVVDTGLTLNYLRKLFDLREPASLRVAALLDRPYRRLVDDLPVDYVGFTVPDEFFVGYGFDVDEPLAQPARPPSRKSLDTPKPGLD